MLCHQLSDCANRRAQGNDQTFKIGYCPSLNHKHSAPNISYKNYDFINSFFWYFRVPFINQAKPDLGKVPRYSFLH